MASSFRSISLTDVASALFEKLVVLQITLFLAENNLLYNKHNMDFVKAGQLSPTR